MVRIAAPNRTWIALAAVAALALAAPAAFAQADPVVETAEANGLVGEQADGFLGIVNPAAATPELESRVDQINIRRRAVYTQRAAQSGASANEMAAAVACQIFRDRINVGEMYRDEQGVWRSRTANEPVDVPSFCE